MKYKLSTKLAFTYGIISVITVGLIIVLSRNYVDKHFISYVKENTERNIDNIVHSIEHQYSDAEGWDNYKLNQISIQALEDGMVLSIKDANGQTIWDTTSSTGKTESELLQPIARNMKKRYLWWYGKLATREIPLHFRETNIGSALIGYYEPFFFTNHDMDFISTLYGILESAMLASTIFAVILGLWISKQISVPLSNTVNLTKEISKGNFEKREEIVSSTIEIKELSDAVNLLAERLKEQDKVRKRIVSDISHELRTPLTAIQNHIEAMIDGIWEPSTERLSNIHGEILRVNRLVGDLSNLSKYESGNEKLNKALFNIGDTLSRVITGFESEIHKKGLSVDVKNTVKEIYGDEDKISQVIVNILSNAIKYSNDNGRIEVSTYEADSKVYIIFKDTGIGIPESELPYIFERFYRVDRSRNRSTGGSGVGLTIAKTIIEAHNGTVEVSSKLGEGTEVTVVLPQKDGRAS